MATDGKLSDLLKEKPGKLLSSGFSSTTAHDYEDGIVHLTSLFLQQVVLAGQERHESTGDVKAHFLASPTD